MASNTCARPQAARQYQQSNRLAVALAVTAAARAMPGYCGGHGGGGAPKLVQTCVPVRGGGVGREGGPGKKRMFWHPASVHPHICSVLYTRTHAHQQCSCQCLQVSLALKSQPLIMLTTIELEVGFYIVTSQKNFETSVLQQIAPEFRRSHQFCGCSSDSKTWGD